MPRITHVAAAQQRYETKPVLDADGKPKQTPVMRNGEQRTTKRGKPVVMTVTERDLSRPLPNYTCGKCRKEIKPGDAYKHISPKSGPYGGRKLVRCATCPSWHVWEYSSSLSARLAEISYNFEQALGDEFDHDSVTDALSEAAEAVREIAQEKQDGADNIEQGFGHETTQSEELRQQGEELETWADDIENADVPEAPEPEEDEDGNTPDEPTEEQLDEWRTEVRETVTIVDESPV